MENFIPTQEQNNLPSKKLGRKLIIAYAVVGIVVLVIVGLAIYRNVDNKAEYSELSSQGQNSLSATQPTTYKGLLSPRKDTSKSPSKLLIHTTNSTENTIYLYDVGNQVLLASSTSLATGNVFNGGLGYGSSYEYNDHTGDIFYITQGASDYDGACMNSDGTCSDRLYKFNIYNGKEIKLSDLTRWPSQWAFNKVDGYIYLSYITPNEDKTWQQSIVKVDTISGKGEEIFNRTLAQGIGLKELKISRDGQYLYQAYESQTNRNGAFFTGAGLAKVNIKDKSLEQKDIFSSSNSSDYLFLDTNISPNEQYFAYWLNFNLEIYDFQTGKTVTIPRESGPTPPVAGAIWSSDSKKLFYGFGGFSGIRYFDVDLSEIVSLKNVPIINSYPLQVLTSSDKFMIYDGGNEEYYLHLYDLRNEKLINLPTYIKQGGIISDWID